MKRSNVSGKLAICSRPLSRNTHVNRRPCQSLDCHNSLVLGQNNGNTEIRQHQPPIFIYQCVARSKVFHNHAAGNQVAGLRKLQAASRQWSCMHRLVGPGLSQPIGHLLRRPHDITQGQLACTTQQLEVRSVGSCCLGQGSIACRRGTHLAPSCPSDSLPHTTSSPSTANLDMCSNRSSGRCACFAGHSAAAVSLSRP
jgi:hypothetical protein